MKETSLPAMVDTSCTRVDPGFAAWTRRSDTVPCVVGCHVMLKVDPTAMLVGRVAMVNIFWADAIAAKALTKNVVEKRMLGVPIMVMKLINAGDTYQSIRLLVWFAGRGVLFLR
jgi:hypothetical protein